jgi:hypothetical protein
MIYDLTIYDFRYTIYAAFLKHQATASIACPKSKIELARFWPEFLVFIGL